jgi:4-nitrophenyl phosphatase
MDDREHLQDRWQPAIQLDKEPAIMVRKPDANMPTPQDNQLMSKHRILSFKPYLRLEWRGQDGQNGPIIRPAYAIPSLHQIGSRFSVHTVLAEVSVRKKQLAIPSVQCGRPHLFTAWTPVSILSISSSNRMVKNSWSQEHGKNCGDPITPINRAAKTISPGKVVLISGIISDLDGVVYRGDNAIPDAVEAFRKWHAEGTPYAFVTNNSSRSANEFAAKLNGMGVQITPDLVFTTVSATASLTRKKWPRGTRVFAIGEKPLLDALMANEFVLTDQNVQLVVIGFDFHLNFEKLRTAIRSALTGVPVIFTNPDVLTPATNGFNPGVGATAAYVRAAVPSITQVFVGKPETYLIEEALSALGTDRTETIMIGDQIATDIVAGRKAGLRSILVTTGVQATLVDGVVPDRTVSSLLNLLTAV